ncbi:hypothetical protein MKZ17_19455 [Solibacillus sp. FSL R7-0682]|uniref:hypothetical protein n=1 Tax=Solibacillus sp. FSL R7-0682 TaxID=2921690 RepID=UPI0030F5155F
MQLPILLVVIFSILAVIKVISKREIVKAATKNEVIFSIISYVGVYAVGLGLIAQMFDWVVSLDLNVAFKYTLSILLLIFTIIVIGQILNKIIPAHLKDVFK